MFNLTSEEIAKLDPQQTLQSTDLLVEQLKKSLAEVQALPEQNFSNITNIVFCGMGASIYGAMVLKSLLGPNLQYPTEIVSDYHLPSFVNETTLVVLTSYSGTTEEVLSCANEALDKKAQIIVLTKGDKLAEFAKVNNIFSYIFDGNLNPSGVPRLGLGYTVIGLIGLLHKAGIAKLDINLLQSAIENTQLNTLKEQAKNDVEKYQNNIPVIFASEHLTGNAQILRNQFNETSKSFSAFYLIPDLNHHLMEGLQFPTNAALKFFIFDSNNYTPKNKKRTELTIEVVKRNKRDVEIFNPNGKDIYEDVINTIVYGSYLTLFLGLSYQQNPAVNPWVDFFKAELKK